MTDTNTDGCSTAIASFKAAPGAGGEALTQSVSDGLSIGDTRTGAGGFARPRTEALSIAEALARVTTFIDWDTNRKLDCRKERNQVREGQQDTRLHGGISFRSGNFRST